MNFTFIYPVIALVAGAMTAYQPLINARLSQQVDSPIWASFISFAVGTVILLAVGLAMNGKFMTLDTNGLKWWMFLGGFLGATFVTAAIYIVPQIGVAALIALLIAGQLIMSAVLDHYGVLAATPNPITWQRCIGISLLAIGAVITLRY